MVAALALVLAGHRHAPTISLISGERWDNLRHLALMGNKIYNAAIVLSFPIGFLHK